MSLHLPEPLKPLYERLQWQGLAQLKGPDQAAEHWIYVGQITTSHGLRGEVQVRPDDESPDWLNTATLLWLQPPEDKPLTRLLLGKGGSALAVEACRPGPTGRVLVAFKAVLRREEAEALSGCALYLQQTELPELAETDTFRMATLIGLRVLSWDEESATREAATDWGVVDGVRYANQGGMVFLDVRLAANDKVIMVPFQEAFFPEVAVAEGWLRVHRLDDFLAEEAGLASSSAKLPDDPTRL